VASNDSFKKVITVTLALCFVCSVIVSSAAVLLKPMQITNKALDFKRNVVSIANINEPGKSVEQIYQSRVQARVVNLETGKFTDEIDAETFDQTKAAKDPAYSTSLSGSDDIAKINRRENYSLVYLIQDESGELEKIMLPVRGKGLWSTMSGLLVLEADLNTVAGFGFYEQAETPGLGGEVDNPDWKAKWVGKQVYDDAGNTSLRVLKGSVDSASADAIHQVDGISGATLTANGVRNLIQFWLGDKGFKPFLTNLKEGEA
jgi:Na+-transporting NADH:ubiquinone oxidoreductase subunit C